jgi:phenylacetate-CoA ligase
VIPISAVPGFVFPAIASEYAAAVWHLLSQLRSSERMPLRDIERLQDAQLDALVRHAFNNSSFWQGRLAAAGWTPDQRFDRSFLNRLPPLTRSDLQNNFDTMRARRLDPVYGPIKVAQTSGSTGAAVRVEKARVQQLLYDAITMRDNIWHRRDFSQKFCAIRPRVKSSARRDWGPPTARLVKTGPAAALDSDKAKLDAQLDWIVAEQPNYLLLTAPRLDGLLQLALERNVRVNTLRQIMTFAGVVMPEIRELARQVFGADIKDLYTTEEVGYIALQCPDHDTYHVQSETVLVELVGDDGTPVPIGTPGHVQVTVLHSFAMPIIRYRLGDMAVAGEPCACGRQRSVLEKILGRQESVLKLPDGRRHVATIRARDFLKFADIREYRVVMYADDVVDVFLTAQKPVPDAARESIRNMIQEKLAYPFPTRIKQVGEIDWGRSWKREGFLRVNRPSE